MVLSSQMSRSGSGRQYMASRRYRMRWRRWVLLVLVLGGAWYYYRSSQPASVDGDAPGQVSPVAMDTVEPINSSPSDLTDQTWDNEANEKPDQMAEVSVLQVESHTSVPSAFDSDGNAAHTGSPPNHVTAVNHSVSVPAPQDVIPESDSNPRVVQPEARVVVPDSSIKRQGDDASVKIEDVALASPDTGPSATASQWASNLDVSSSPTIDHSISGTVADPPNLSSTVVTAIDRRSPSTHTATAIVSPQWGAPTDPAQSSVSSSKSRQHDEPEVVSSSDGVSANEPETESTPVPTPGSAPGLAVGPGSGMMPPIPPTSSAALANGLALIQDGQLVAGRRALSELLLSYEDGLTSADAKHIRQTLSDINESLIFSPKVEPDDTVAEYYSIQSGDLLSRVAPRYHITYQLIERINRVSARRIRVGQQVKVIHGPFHVVVDKSDYRMDVYLPEPDGGMVYIRSFTVGLGQDDSTPEGSWVVRRGGKLINPGWTNPRTGQLYEPDDPRNPIGEYWVALSGTDSHTQELMGYGIHGTIEPESIGQSASMGCVRMSDEDIELVYFLLKDGLSTVIIRP